jgi:hypothetical protein
VLSVIQVRYDLPTRFVIPAGNACGPLTLITTSASRAYGLTELAGVASGTWVQVYRAGMKTNDRAWVPQACTLPTAERPLRVAEFDALFVTALRGQQRVAPTLLRWQMDPAAEPAARDLAGREAGCCSVFTFTFAPAGNDVEVDVEVPAASVGVLDALAQRAAARMRS